jgi:hypothetical protein
MLFGELPSWARVVAVEHFVAAESQSNILSDCEPSRDRSRRIATSDMDVRASSIVDRHKTRTSSVLRVKCIDKK